MARAISPWLKPPSSIRKMTLFALPNAAVGPPFFAGLSAASKEEAGKILNPNALTAQRSTN
jgi:hypothetical protein